MLKIKDEVDLKELEKFGFEYYGNYNRGDCWRRENIIFKKNGKDFINGITISENFNKEISYLYPYAVFEYPPIENYIIDLIKADLVEKVEE